jgi:molybdopterin-containing oxidoreductase family iron-sulfur binding subunit
MTHYGMALDTKRCIGCNACTVACKVANNVPQDIFWTRATTDGGDMPDTPAGTYPKVSMTYYTVGCQHCENPACVKVCPVGATYSDPETGVVRQDYDKCIGCRMCMSACPYTGVRSFNWEEPKYPFEHALGDADSPKHQKHTVEKCTFCYQRTSQGNDPACMELCPARARTWGDLDDPDSDVSKLIASRNYTHLLEEKGTKPSIYFLV